MAGVGLRTEKMGGSPGRERELPRGESAVLFAIALFAERHAGRPVLAERRKDLPEGEHLPAACRDVRPGGCRVCVSGRVAGGLVLLKRHKGQWRTRLSCWVPRAAATNKGRSVE